MSATGESDMRNYVSFTPHGSWEPHVPERSLGSVETLITPHGDWEPPVLGGFAV